MKSEVKEEYRLIYGILMRMTSETSVRNTFRCFFFYRK